MPTKTSKKTASAELVAEFFIKKAQEEGEPVSNKKLQKLLYFSQAWSLALNDKPIFKEEIEAWVHGPAIRSIYTKYKKYGFHGITEEIQDRKFESLNVDLLNEIWRVYGKYDADYLEVLTHNEDPWQNARKGFEPSDPANNVISHDDMAVFYRKRYEDATAS